MLLSSVKTSRIIKRLLGSNFLFTKRAGTHMQMTSWNPDSCKIKDKNCNYSSEMHLVFNVIYSHHAEGFQGLVSDVCAGVGMALP